MEALPTFELPSTPSVTFTGHIHPTSFRISLSTALRAELITQPDTPLEGLRLSFQFTIQDSEVEVNCYVNQIIASSNQLSKVLFHASVIT